MNGLFSFRRQDRRAASSFRSGNGNNDLSKPLLLVDDRAGNHDDHDDHDDYDYVDAESTTFTSSSSSSSSSSSTTPTPATMESWCDSFLAWFVLPCLLWLDFWLVLHNSSSTAAAAASTAAPVPAHVVSMASVHASFVMFIVASLLYRKTLEEHECESVLLLLVPEIAMNAMLLLIFATQTFAAYVLLLATVLALSIVVVAFSAIRLGCVHEVVVVIGTNQDDFDDAADDDDDDEETGRGIVAVVKPAAAIRR
jgi:hypothetical protein